MKECCWLYANEKINTYTACFIGKSVNQLVEDFNQEVGLKELTQDRAYYHEALIRAFEERGVDTSKLIYEGEISFQHRIKFDRSTQQLIMID